MLLVVESFVGSVKWDQKKFDIVLNLLPEILKKLKAYFKFVFMELFKSDNVMISHN